MINKLFFVLIFCYQFAFAQVGIGTTDIHSSAIVELKSSSKGFLMPRVTAEQKSLINNPVAGLSVYCTNCCGGGSISFFNGSTWYNVGDCKTIDFDDDGVVDSIDVDDDNDGILDKDEMLDINIIPSLPCVNSYKIGDNILLKPIVSGFPTTVVPKGSITYIYSSDYIVIELDDNLSTLKAKVRISLVSITNLPGTSPLFGIQITNQNKLKIIYVSSNPTNPPVGYVEVEKTAEVKYEIFDYTTDTDALLNGSTTQLQLSLNLDINFLDIDKQDVKYEKISFQKDPNIKLIAESGNGYVFEEISTEMITSGTEDDPISPVRFSYNNQNTFNVKYTIFGEVRHFDHDFDCALYSFVKPIEIIGADETKDSDNDGLVNRLDLDSDADNCSDAFEAGRTTNTSSNFKFNAQVGYNGYHNSLETGDTIPANPINKSTYTFGKAFDGTCP